MSVAISQDSSRVCSSSSKLYRRPASLAHLAVHNLELAPNIVVENLRRAKRDAFLMEQGGGERAKRMSWLVK